jgi:SAM-dependent methyltransferase
MDRSELYDTMATRKSAPKDLEPYRGDNGRVNRCVDLFRQGKLRRGGALLDIGGGIGDLAYACRDMFERAVVVDISAKNLEAARAKGCVTLQVDIDREGLEKVGGQFDVVTALDFIEHIVDPESFARECFRVLKPGGEVFINTPNIQHFRHIEQLVRGRFPHTSGDRDVYHGGHLAFFTYLDLVDIFLAAGFDARRFEQFKDDEGYVAPPQEWIDRAHAKTQREYVDACMRFGNSNLLFKAVKP